MVDLRWPLPEDAKKSNKLERQFIDLWKYTRKAVQEEAVSYYNCIVFYCCHDMSIEQMGKGKA